MGKNKTIGILGGGVWGKTLAEKLNKGGEKVIVYHRDLKVPLLKRKNIIFFKEIENLKESKVFIIAVPSFAIREVLLKLKKFFKNQPLVGVSKGIERKTGYFSSQIAEDILGKIFYAHLSGPSFAKEVKRGSFTKLVLATLPAHFKKFSFLLKIPHLKIELSDDLIGVQFLGAFKNVIALACGISDGLHLGHNFRSILIMEGFNEMKKLGKRLKVKEETLLSPAGLGDLILTATSLKSRNYRCGINLAKKGKILKNLTVEGIDSSFGILKLAKREKLNLPLVETVVKVIEGKNPLLVFEKIKEKL